MYDRVPAQAVLEDKTLLREWEMEIMDDYLRHVYDRRLIDMDVFRKLQANGEIIKMAVNSKDLTKD